ncbi:chloride conductance regulatory protein ICln, partial [Tanacetum coccineum]
MLEGAWQLERGHYMHNWQDKKYENYEPVVVPDGAEGGLHLAQTTRLVGPDNIAVCDSESSETPLDLSKITEMRLVPSDPTQLDTLFEVLCECAELNSEPEDGDISEWNNIQIPLAIGHANGDDDLASSVLKR